MHQMQNIWIHFAYAKHNLFPFDFEDEMWIIFMSFTHFVWQVMLVSYLENWLQ